MPKASCWKCYPDLDPGCIRPSSLLCDEHRTAEHDRLQALKDKYAHLTLEEQHKLWKREHPRKAPPRARRGPRMSDDTKPDDDIQVTIHGRYGQGPMPVEFRDALVEMVRLVKQAIDDGTLGRPVCPKCGSHKVIEPGERYPRIWTCDPCGYDFEARRAASSEPEE